MGCGYTDWSSVESDGLSGLVNDGTGAGIHCSGVGFRRDAYKLIPVLKPLIEK